MKHNSVFNIIGPIMIGSLERYDIEAFKMGKLARELFFYEPEKIEITLYGENDKENKYFGLNRALIGGILDFELDNPLIKNVLTIAKKKGIYINYCKEFAKPLYRNTIKINLYKGAHKVEIIACSKGWGKIELLEVNNFKLKRKEETPALLVIGNNYFGSITSITYLLSRQKISINMMRISKEQEGNSPIILIETNDLLSFDLINKIRKEKDIYQAVILD